MENSFLMQTEIVEKLLKVNSKVLPTLPEGDLKNALIEAMENFKVAITPSTLYLNDIYSILQIHSMNLNKIDAIQLLNSAAKDVDLNYASSVVSYHVDNYISDLK